MIHDDAIEQVKQDLYTWGEWVRKNKIPSGYGNSSISRLDKDETKRQRKSRRENLATLEIMYRNGRPFSAQYGENAVYVPVQEITAPKTKPAARQYTQAEAVDDLCLEIETYLGILEARNKTARILVNHLYLSPKKWPREASMRALRITKDRYTQIKNYIPVFILSQRYQKLTSGRPDVIRV